MALADARFNREISDVPLAALGNNARVLIDPTRHGSTAGRFNSLTRHWAPEAQNRFLRCCNNFLMPSRNS